MLETSSVSVIINVSIVVVIVISIFGVFYVDLKTAQNVSERGPDDSHIYTSLSSSWNTNSMDDVRRMSSVRW